MTARIIVADDEPCIVGVLAEVLEDEGYAVTRAHDGASALAAVERDRPDLLITDQMMPGGTGAALIRLLRARERGPGPPLPIILMSAGVAVAAVPPTVFLTKPFDLAQVLALVTRLLAR